MNATELKIYLKSNPTSNFKLDNNVLNYIIPYSKFLQKREREAGRAGGGGREGMMMIDIY